MKTPEQLARKREKDARYRSRHREHIRTYLAGWYAANQDHIKAYQAATKDRRAAYSADRNLRAHGITPEQYAELLAAQGGGCAICGATESPRPRDKTRTQRLCVDHDHACCPGTHSCGSCVRGLICDRCNRGHFDEDPARLRAAADYFERARA